MRTYIFTENERRTVRNFLNGTITRSDPNFMTIVSRIKSFTDLSSDIDLYIKLRETVRTLSA